MAKAGTNEGFLLKHLVGSVPHGFEVDVPLNYANCYFGGVDEKGKSDRVDFKWEKMLLLLEVELLDCVLLIFCKRKAIRSLSLINLIIRTELLL